jgi:exonuclease SbcC
MIPLRLRLRGAIGVYDGLGLDDLDVDLTIFQPGLVCLVGPNGSGKTTVLENLQPFRCLQSRAGPLQDHFRLKDSYKELFFRTHDGGVYRSLVSIDANSRKQEPYLYRRNPDGSETPMTRGGTDAYDLEIKKLLGSHDLFFCSVFAGQRAQGFTSLKVSDRKELFLELITRVPYQLYYNYAKQRAEEIVERLVRTRLQVKDLVDRRDSLPRLRKKLESLKTDEEILRGEISRLEAKVTIAQSRRDEAFAEKERDKQARAESDRIERDIKAVEGKVQVVREQVSEAEQSLRLSPEQVQQMIDKVEDLERKEKEFQTSKDLLAEVERRQAEAYLKAKMEIAEHTRRVDAAEQKLVHAQQHLVALLDRVRVARQMARAAVMELENDAALVDDVPCSETEAGRALHPGLPERCRLLAGATRSRDQLPAAIAEAKRKDSDEFLDEQGVTGLENLVRAAREELEAQSKKEPDLGRYGFTLVGDELDASYWDGERQRIGYDAAEHKANTEELGRRRSEDWPGVKAEMSTARARIDAAKDALAELAERERQLREDLARLVLNDRAGRALDAAERVLWQAKEDVATGTSRLTSVAIVVGTTEAEIQSTDEGTADLEALQQKVETDERLAEDWRVLQRAVSNDGIPPLELDAAGGVISAYCNDLLVTTFGADYQVAFTTLRLTKDRKKYVEDFDLKVVTPKGEKMLNDLSGGERLWIEHALAEAIAIFHSEAGGRKFLTAWADEKDGAFDADNKQHYLEMLRRARAIAGRELTLLITHTPELSAQVQQRLRFIPGTGVTCEL